MTRVRPRLNAKSGVRYWRPDRRPRWRMTAHGGTSQAYKPWMRLVTRLLKRATPRESFIAFSRGLAADCLRRARDGQPRRKSSAYSSSLLV